MRIVVVSAGSAEAASIAAWIVVKSQLLRPVPPT
jgi:hypothetical protein